LPDDCGVLSYLFFFLFELTLGRRESPGLLAIRLGGHFGLNEKNHRKSPKIAIMTERNKGKISVEEVAQGLRDKEFKNVVFMVCQPGVRRHLVLLDSRSYGVPFGVTGGLTTWVQSVGVPVDQVLGPSVGFCMAVV
jgi:hypothetical protein